MSRPHLSLVKAADRTRDLETLVERWLLYVELYEASTPPEQIDGASYTAGFQAGVRKMAMEAALGVREALR